MERIPKAKRTLLPIFVSFRTLYEDRFDYGINRKRNYEIFSL